MERAKIINHELGHGIVAYLFHNHYYTFEGIKLNPEKKFNENDYAYTESRPIADLAAKVDSNNHLAAAVDGLFLLAGIAGLTVFSNRTEVTPLEATKTNYKDIFNFERSSGDFEVINRANRPYGWYLFQAGRMNQEMAEIRHVRILNLLKKLFMKEIILNGSKMLQEKLDINSELKFSDFRDVFDDDFVQSTIQELTEFIKSGLGKPILVE